MTRTVPEQRLKQSSTPAARLTRRVSILLVLSLCGCSEPECWEVAVDSCETSGCQAVVGSPFDIDAFCYESSRVVGCIDTPIVCSDAVWHAVSPDGTCVAFASSCFPTNWTTEEWCPQEYANYYPEACTR